MTGARRTPPRVWDGSRGTLDSVQTLLPKFEPLPDPDLADPSLPDPLPNPADASPIHLAMLEFETLCCALPRAALDGYARWHEEPCVVERPGLRMQASLRAAEAALALGELTEADRWLGLAAPVLARLPPFDLDVDSAWRIAEVVYAASGDLDRAAEAAGHAKRVVAEVASRLPEAWRADYLASRREAKTFSAPPRDRRPSRAATARRRASRAVRSRPAQ